MRKIQVYVAGFATLLAGLVLGAVATGATANPLPEAPDPAAAEVQSVNPSASEVGQTGGTNGQDPDGTEPGTEIPGTIDPALDRDAVVSRTAARKAARRKAAQRRAVRRRAALKRRAAKRRAAKRRAAKRRAARRKAARNRAPRVTSRAPYSARGSVGDAYVEGATPGSTLLLVNARNRIVRRGKADSFGSKIFYDVAPGAVFTVRTPTGRNSAQGTPRFRVLRPGQNPPRSFYRTPDKELKAGLNYITMRDGTELAVTVRLPFGRTSLAQGPFPTFIEYSGYQTAAPHDGLTGLLAGLPSGLLPDGLLDGLLPGGQLPGGLLPDPDLTPATSTAVGSIIGPLLDFAVVSVQMRGSGCSGGAFDLFGWPTTYDGYDVIETVAAQDWVEGGKVSMGGISFSGITQLFTAGTRPPSLSAVSPLSVTDDVYQGTGFPGGIFNDGFAYSWITERAEEAKPAPEGGQPWARKMASEGDAHVRDPQLREYQKQRCLENQKMRLQTRDYNHLIETNPFRTPGLFEKRSPAAWVKHIDVPIFWAGTFQDEQTGGHWPEAIANLPRQNSDVWVTLGNGVHVDTLGPDVITRWAEFMNLFTGNGRVPVINPVVILAGPVLYQFLASSGSTPIQQSRYALWLNTPQNVARARADFRRDPRIRVLMDNGAAVAGQPGAIGAKWETNFNAWPAPSLTPRRYFLGPNGSLSPIRAARASAAAYVSDPSARPPRTLGDNAQSDSWLAQPPYNWQPVVERKGLGFITPPLTEDTFIAGPSSVDLYLRSNMRNTDIQVTLTEVRPDGNETYVQNGWLRTSHRKLDRAKSNAYNPVQTWLEKDRAPLRRGKFNLTRVQIYPVAHVFRAGSRIRLNIQAPGGDRTIWNFATIERGRTRNQIGLGGAIPSSLVLPVIPGRDAQGTALPGPTDLRGQPSRRYVPASNGG